MKRRAAWIALSSGGLLALIVLLRGCDGLFYYPDAVIHATPASLNLNVEEVSFSAPGGPPLHGWWIPASGTSHGTVVYCHGNHRNLTHHAQFVRWLPADGFQLLIFDYRGYGKSGGAPTRSGLVADAAAAINFALQRDPERTVVFGHSLGGAMGLLAAVDQPAVRAVVIESSFSSHRAAARHQAGWLGFLVPLVISEGLDPVQVVARLAPRPLHIIHGTADHITPLSLARELFEAAREPKSLRVVPGGGHRSPWVEEGVAFEQELTKFFHAAIAK